MRAIRCSASPSFRPSSCRSAGTLAAALFAVGLLSDGEPLTAQAGAVPDLSGYWVLPIDGRFVPPARLSPRDGVRATASR